mgnify:CR=1 FL=1
MDYKILMNLEEGYRIEVINDNGFVKERHDISQEELAENIKDLCKYSTDKIEDRDKLLDTLRDAYQLFDLKSIKFKMKGK